MCVFMWFYFLKECMVFEIIFHNSKTLNLLKKTKKKTVILNCNNISQYHCC